MALVMCESVRLVVVVCVCRLGEECACGCRGCVCVVRASGEGGGQEGYICFLLR